MPDNGLSGCVNMLLGEVAEWRAEVDGWRSIADQLAAALDEIGTTCTNYAAPPFCPDAGRGRDARYTADRWCDACIARAALARYREATT